MKNRDAFELKNVLIVYNILQVILNIYATVMGIPLCFWQSEWIGPCCQVIKRYSFDLERLAYVYAMLKVFDLLDTVFFILRKRNNQVTFLHFYHHIIACGATCITYQYKPNGHVAMMGLVNSFVHAVMYFYYLMSSVRTDVKQSLWWKRYITLVQIVQFVFLIGWFLYPMASGQECGYPFRLMSFVFLQNVIMLVLFGKFYIEAYVLKLKNK